MIPYAKQNINQADINSVSKVLKSEFLTTGPEIEKLEKKFSSYVGSKYAVAVINGTAALHLACLAAKLQPKEEVITSSLSFAASANCALYCNAKPIFVDVNQQGLIDETKIESQINSKTKIIIPVHYAGFPCNLSQIKIIAKKYRLIVIEDACHAPGAKYKKSMIGDCSYSDMTVFSFHPVKHITTGEGGMITTNSKKFYHRLLLFRNHGITKDPKQYLNKSDGPWYHEMQELGFNYRLNDIQATLGISQLKRIKQFIKKRRKIAQIYDRAFTNSKNIEIIKENKDQASSYHLYPIRVKDSKTRLKLFNYLMSKNIFCQVHYIPIYWHPYYQKLAHSPSGRDYKKGLCPKAEDFYKREISIPMFFSLNSKTQNFVIKSILEFLN